MGAAARKRKSREKIKYDPQKLQIHLEKERERDKKRRQEKRTEMLKNKNFRYLGGNYISYGLTGSSSTQRCFCSKTKLPTKMFTHIQKVKKTKIHILNIIIEVFNCYINKYSVKMFLSFYLISTRNTRHKSCNTRHKLFLFIKRIKYIKSTEYLYLLGRNIL